MTKRHCDTVSFNMPAPFYTADMILNIYYFSLIWLIRLAWNAAPKPLSIFTTLTPLAQELSMLSKAEIPWKEAP